VGIVWPEGLCEETNEGPACQNRESTAVGEELEDAREELKDGREEFTDGLREQKDGPARPMDSHEERRVART